MPTALSSLSLGLGLGSCFQAVPFQCNTSPLLLPLPTRPLAPTAHALRADTAATPDRLPESAVARPGRVVPAAGHRQRRQPGGHFQDNAAKTTIQHLRLSTFPHIPTLSANANGTRTPGTSMHDADNKSVSHTPTNAASPP